MSGTSSNAKYAGKKNKGRGSTDNKGRLEAFSKGRTMGGANWGTADPVRVAAVVCSITDMGGACTFGLSRDMGSHSLHLMLDKNHKTLWFNGDADLDEELDAVLLVLEGQP